MDFPQNLRHGLVAALLLAGCAPRAPLPSAPMYAKRTEAEHGMVAASHPAAAP